MRRAFAASLAWAALALSSPSVASGDTPDPHRWVDRPLILNPFRASLDVAASTAQAPTLTGPRGGPALNLEAAIGLPLLFELRLRTGYRATDGARIAGADTHARLFDPETSNVGADRWANPELGLRVPLVAIGTTTIGLESRFVLPVADATHFTVSPGVPVRVRIDRFARIDTGLYFPFAYEPGASYTIGAPAQLWIQAADFFFGPMTAVHFHHFDTTDRVDVAAGLSAGLTVARLLDLKAQVYTRRINDSDWQHTLGFGLGAGITFP